MPRATRCLASDAKRFVTALASVVVLLVLLPGAAFAAEKGLVTDLSWGTSSSDQDRTAAASADLGSKWGRVNLNWRDIETSKGARNSSAVSRYDRAVTLTRQSGSKVIVMVSRAPGWASGSSNIEAPAQNPADYASFMTWLATHYRGQVEAYEIWNEQNTVRFWPAGVNAGQYAAQLKAAYPAVKQGDPAAKVLFGGMAFSDWQFVEAAYAAEPNLGQYFDVMATHPYTGSRAEYTGAAPPEAITRGPDGRMDMYSFPAYRELRTTMAAHGGAKPIWFTEFGWSTETGDGWGVTQAQQADYLTRALRYVEQDPYVEVACWYNLRNNFWSGNANNWDSNLGLMKTDFSHKPSYDTFKAYTPGAGPAPTPDPTPAPAPNSTPAPAPTPAPTTDPTAPTTPPTTTSARPKKKTRTSLRVGTAATSSATTSAVASRARSYSLAGRVVASSGGFVTIRLQRAAGSSRAYRTVRLLRVRLTSAGSFVTRVRLRGSGTWRVRASFSGSSTDLPSASGFAYLRR